MSFQSPITAVIESIHIAAAHCVFLICLTFPSTIYFSRGIYTAIIWTWSFWGWVRALGLICSITFSFLSYSWNSQESSPILNVVSLIKYRSDLSLPSPEQYEMNPLPWSVKWYSTPASFVIPDAQYRWLLAFLEQMECGSQFPLPEHDCSWGTFPALFTSFPRILTITTMK